MSQRNVEQVIGRLVTDEGFRRRFAADPRGELERLLDEGVALNPCELEGLAAIDFERLARFAESLHPCIEKVELPGADRSDVENHRPASTHYRTDDGDRGPAARPLADRPSETRSPGDSP